MKELAMVVVLVVGVMAGGMAQAQSTLKPKQQKEECEVSCNNRPEVPKTRGLKPKPQKEGCADENTCNNRPEVPKTRALKQKKGKECSSTDYCG